MTEPFAWWTLIPYYVPAFLMAGLLYAALVRGLLGLVVAKDSPNLLWQGLCRRTGWLLCLTRAITPVAIGPAWLPFCAVFWIAVLRVAFYVVMVQAGMGPLGTPGS